MGIFDGVMREAQPLIVRGVVQMLHESVRDLVRGPALAPAAPQLMRADEAEGGCPYCAMREHLWVAIGAAVDANATTEPMALAVYEHKYHAAIAGCCQAGNTVEVILDREGAAILNDVMQLEAQGTGDWPTTIRALYALKERCVAKAIERNRPAQANPPVREVESHIVDDDGAGVEV